MATQSSIIAWRIPLTVETGGLQFMGSQRVNTIVWLTLKICLVAHSCPTPCDPLDFSLPGSFVLWIFQTRIVEWVAIFSCMGSSPPKDQTRISCVSCTSGRFFTCWANESPFMLRLLIYRCITHLSLPFSVSYEYIHNLYIILTTWVCIQITE